VTTTPPIPPQPVGFTTDGLRLAGLLYRPAGDPRGALLVCHGAGSRKENHVLMGEQAAAAGLAALTFDFRGHGDSAGVMDPDGWHDAVAAAETLLRLSRAPWVAGRGASMGGCMLLLAAHARPGLFGSLVALCPADGQSLLAGLDDLEREDDRGARIGAEAQDDGVARIGAQATRAPADAGAAGAEGDIRRPARRHSGRFDAAALRPFLERLDLTAVAAGMPRVLLAHARDDDVVPFAHSERLAAVLAPPTRFLVLKGGGHHAPGRSPEVARATLAWVLANAPEAT
jgi:alpha-beta hydrolase superfamily lysophospholipase